MFETRTQKITTKIISINIKTCNDNEDSQGSLILTACNRAFMSSWQLIGKQPPVSVSPKFHHNVYKRTPKDTLLSPQNPVSIICSTIIAPCVLTFLKWIYSLRFFDKNSACISHFTQVCYMFCSIHLSGFNHLNNIKQTVTDPNSVLFLISVILPS